LINISQTDISIYDDDYSNPPAVKTIEGAGYYPQAESIPGRIDLEVLV
jgi:hypothetical protein